MALALAPPRRARQQRHLADRPARRAGRLRHARPPRPGALRRQGRRPAHARALVLRPAPAAARASRARSPRWRGSTRRRTGSELEAALFELDLIRRWRPPGNVRDKRPDRAVYLRLGLAEHAPALGVREVVRDDGAVYAGPFASRRRATEAAEALRDGYGLRTCRPRVPVDDGSCLRGAAGRCLAPCHGADDALAYARSARALASWLAGEEAVLEAPLRERVARLIAQQRFEDARRATRLVDALRAADAQVASIRQGEPADGRPARLRSRSAPRGGVRGRARRARRQAPPAACGRSGARAGRRRAGARARARSRGSARAAR